MSRRLGAVVVVALLAMAALVVIVGPPEPAGAARTCPPVTIDDLFPPATQPPSPKPTPTTTAPGGSDSTTTTTPEEPDPETTTTSETTPTTQPPPGTTVTEPPTDETTVTSPPTDETTVTTTPTGEDPSPTPAPTPTPRGPSGCEPFRYGMMWPLAGAGQIISGFGADRDHGSRHHQGVDIAAPKLTPVVAVADGVVMGVTQVVGTEECCWMSLRHDDGWQSYYVHLNNDLYGTDDGTGIGVRPDLVEGTEVTKGEVIGWVGDSGNAEETVDHLHFELRTSGGEAVDPVPSVRAAQRQAVLLDPQPNWPYADDDGLDLEWHAATLLTQGLFLPCDETMTTFCPGRLASPELANEIITHISGRSPPAFTEPYLLLRGSFRPDLHPALTHMLSLGCDAIENCLSHGITATELARPAAWVRIDDMVTRLLPKSVELKTGEPVVNLPGAEDAESRLRADGVVSSCTPPLSDQLLLTREATLNFLLMWVGGAEPQPCSVGFQPNR